MATRSCAAGTILVGLLVLFALLAPLLAPYSRAVNQYPNGLNADGMPLPPSRSFLLGTDDLGRDVLVRLLYGSRISLTVGIAAMLVAVAFGIVIGLYSGYYGGWVDVVLMRFTDMMMAVPALLLAMALAGLMKGGVGRTVQLWLPGLSAPLFEFKLERGMIGIILVVARRQLDRHRPRRARPGVGPQGTRFCRSGSRHRLLAHAHPLAASYAECVAGHHRSVRP